VSGLANVDLFKVSQSYAKKGAIRMVNNVCVLGRWSWWNQPGK